MTPQPYRFVGTYALFNDADQPIEFKRFGQQVQLTDAQAHFCLESRIPIVPEELFHELGIPEGANPTEEGRASAVQAAVRYRTQRLTPALPNALKEMTDAN